MQEGVVRLTLSGRMETEYLPDLRRLIEAEDGRPGLTLDLEEVQLVDQDAVRFLARCEDAGAKLERCAPYVRECITRERRPRIKTSRSLTTTRKRGER